MRLYHFTVCETETADTEVLDDVPDCEIEQVDVCDTDEESGKTTCRKVPQQVCSVSKQGRYSVWS